MDILVVVGVVMAGAVILYLMIYILTRITRLDDDFKTTTRDLRQHIHTLEGQKDDPNTKVPDEQPTP
ncbi:MAG: hypothetical protein OHK0046_14750 [Anaerolineae bacterium]